MIIWNQSRWSRHSSVESVPEEGPRKDAGKLGGCLRRVLCALGQQRPQQGERGVLKANPDT